MLDFKATFDAVNAAHAASLAIYNQIAELLKSGSDEDVKKALDLRPALDEAEQKAKDLTDIYERMKAQASKNVLELFVPASTTQTTPEPQEQPTGVMKRADFFALDSAAKRKFITSGGIIDEA